jgi:hypothetical protein
LLPLHLSSFFIFYFFYINFSKFCFLWYLVAFSNITKEITSFGSINTFFFFFNFVYFFIAWFFLFKFRTQEEEFDVNVKCFDADLCFFFFLEFAGGGPCE